ncbi:hypothetical protein TNCV_3644931 [Trichonephila clavipes]|nr:hypothetical protein TNCV_3644931 [Trichonephila clavipes]
MIGQGREEEKAITTEIGTSLLQMANINFGKRGMNMHGSPGTYWPRFGTVGLMIVPKIEGDVERSTFFNKCRSSGSRAQMDTQPSRIFRHGRNEEMDRTIEQMCSC